MSFPEAVTQRELQIQEFFRVNEKLATHQPLSQDDFKRAVVAIDELWVGGGKVDYAEPVCMLVDAVMNDKVVIDPDEAVAAHLAELRRKTMMILELEMDSAGGTDCIGMEKDEESVDLDMRIAEMRLSHFDWVANYLIEQMAPASVE